MDYRLAVGHQHIPSELAQALLDFTVEPIHPNTVQPA